MKSIFIFVFLLLLNPSYVFATADGPDCWEVTGVADNDVLNIRLAPNTKAKILATIPPHAKSVINSNTGMCPDDPATPAPPECGVWCRVTYNKITGWAKCTFLKGTLRGTSDCH